MVFRHRVFWLLLVLSCFTACGVSAPAIASQCGDCGQAEARSEDQIWLVSTRHLGSIGCDGEAGPDVLVYRCDSRGCWVAADLDAFYGSDDPKAITCFYVHAARVDHAEVVPRSLAVYRALVAGENPDVPIRLVIWSWPADKTRRPLQDFRRLAVRADSEACRLARFLSGVNPDVKVSLVGFSMGPRIITGALHLLGGGELEGFKLADGALGRRVRVRAVLWAPALHSDWLWPGHYHGMAMSQVDHMLVLYNSCDPVLARYAALDPCSSPEALGYVGLPCPERLGEARARIEAEDLRGVVGKAHSFHDEISSSFVIEATRKWALWKPVENR